MKTFKLKRMVVHDHVDRCLKSETVSVRVKITLPSAGSWSFQKIALRILCIFMCIGTGLLVLKLPSYCCKLKINL